MAKKHQTLHNALFNTASWVFSIGINFVFLPYIVARLGTESYGILVLILAVIGYFAMLELNLGQAMTKYVAEYRAKGDLAQVNDIIGSTMLLYLLLGLSGGAIIFGLADVLATRFLKVPPELQETAMAAFRVGSVGFVLTMLVTAMQSIPWGLNRYDVSSRVTMAMNLLTTLSMVGLLVLGYGLLEVVLVNVAVPLLGVLTYVVICRRLLPGIRLRPVFRPGPLKTILRFGLYSSLSRLSGVLRFQADRLLTGAILGLSWVTYYVVPFSLVRKLMTVTYLVGSVILPVVSGFQGKQDHKAIVALYLKASRLITTIAMCVCLPLMLFGNRFLGFWMGEEFAAQAGLVVTIITAALLVDAFTNIPSIVVDGMGRPKVTGLFSICTALINLALVYPLGKALGVSGVALAFLGSNLLVGPVFVWYANNRVLGHDLLSLVRRSYLPPLSAGAAAAVLAYLLLAPLATGMLSLLAVMAATSTLFLLLACLTGAINRDELGQAAEYASPLFARFRLLSGRQP
ncbi:MAG: flippase [Desulfocurvibacter africanus]